MSEDQFTKLFKYAEKHFDAVEVKLTDTRKDQIDIEGAIGEFNAQVRDYHNQMIISFHKIDTLREAILQIAQRDRCTAQCRTVDFATLAGDSEPIPDFSAFERAIV